MKSKRVSDRGEGGILLEGKRGCRRGGGTHQLQKGNYLVIDMAVGGGSWEGKKEKDDKTVSTEQHQKETNRRAGTNGKSNCRAEDGKNQSDSTTCFAGRKKRKSILT